MKLCKRCDKIKPINEFRARTDKTRKDGNPIYRELCLLCERIVQLARYHNMPLDKKRERRKRSLEKLPLNYHKSYKLQKYKITLDEFDEMCLKQGGKCYICDSIIKGRKIRIDHNHKTGKVRKLLCHNCNTALGLLKEDVNIFLKCILYLEEHA